MGKEGGGEDGGGEESFLACKCQGQGNWQRTVYCALDVWTIQLLQWINFQ